VRAFLAVAILAFLFGCQRTPGVKEGALYTVDDGDGFYRVVKILATDDRGVHVRMYKNRWKERPTSVDTSSLSLGQLNDPDGLGMGHLPFSKKSFVVSRPVFLQDGQVAEDELEGYRMWKDGGGGYF